VSIIYDADEIRRLEAQHYDSRPREVDAPLLTVLCVVFTAAGLSLLLIFDPERFPVDRGRVVLTMAGVAVMAATFLVAVYLLNRANTRRHGELKEQLELITKRQRTLLESQSLLPAEDDPTVRSMTKEAYRLGLRRRMGEDR
jgi:hypothetical protein